MSEHAALAADDLVDVRVLRLPVPLWERSQEHSDSLMREFALIASDAVAHPGGDHVPARLLRLVQSLNGSYSGFTGEQEAALQRAAERGEPEVDLDYRVPRSASGAAAELGRLLDEADEYCLQGRHLLTLATPPEELRFRRWFLAQFVDQPAGRAPVAWPDYDG